MAHFVGLDVSVKETAVCVVASEARQITRGEDRARAAGRALRRAMNKLRGDR